MRRKSPLPCSWCTAARIVVSPSGSEAFHKAAGSTDKTFARYPEGYHELFNDLDKGAFVDAVIDWIRARI